MNIPSLSSNPTSSASGSSLSRYMDRRNFLRTGAYFAGGSLLLNTSKSAIAQATEGGRTIKCALVGCGAQGNALRIASKDVPGIQWVAICDIWKFSQNKTIGGLFGENKHQVEGTAKEFAENHVYTDIEEMLDKEPSIEAVFIATPDFLHAPHSRIALSRGKSVYCEKMMSNTIEGAYDMVKAGKEFSGIFQIGHQRHSNPRYINLRENVINKHQLLGRITHCYGQWNRGVSASQPQGIVKGYEIPQEILTKYGYDNIDEFRNWRSFAKYGGGPLSDLGAHQIDMFNWMYQTTPVSVYASGGTDYYDGTEGRLKFELPDNMMCIYEYKLPTGVMRAYYQVLTTTGSQGFYEKHMGVKGTAIISETPNYNQLYAEPSNDWDEFSQGENPIIKKPADAIKNKFWEHTRTWDKPKPPSFGEVSFADVRESKAPTQWDLGVTLKRYAHSPHVQNFIEAVQTKNPNHLTCNVNEAYKACVTVLKAYNSQQSGSKYLFTPEDFAI
jgi:predicted dehydrogenase